MMENTQENYVNESLDEELTPEEELEISGYQPEQVALIDREYLIQRDSEQAEPLDESENPLIRFAIASVLVGGVMGFAWMVWSIFCFISSYPNQQTRRDDLICLQMIPKISSTNGIAILQHKAILKHWLQGQVLQPSGISEAQAGVSEKDFYRVLIRIFPNVSQGAAFDNPNSPYPYSADFILVHTSGLSIDIEIDEPYVGNTKEPHHCVDQGKDKMRNQFFTNNNWVVIRFSEKQIVKYAYRCCKVIASVIARVTGDYTFLARLQNLPNLPIEPMWNIKQAKKWARLDYRKSYLPIYQK